MLACIKMCQYRHHCKNGFNTLRIKTCMCSLIGDHTCAVTVVTTTQLTELWWKIEKTATWCSNVIHYKEQSLTAQLNRVWIVWNYSCRHKNILEYATSLKQKKQQKKTEGWFDELLQYVKLYLSQPGWQESFLFSKKLFLITQLYYCNYQQHNWQYTNYSQKCYHTICTNTEGQ